jgi:hypothetical protein
MAVYINGETAVLAYHLTRIRQGEDIAAATPAFADIRCTGLNSSYSARGRTFSTSPSARKAQHAEVEYSMQATPARE